MKTTFVLMLGFVVPLAISCHVSDVNSDADTNATSDTATDIDTESITGVDPGPMIDTATSVDSTTADSDSALTQIALNQSHAHLEWTRPAMIPGLYLRSGGPAMKVARVRALMDSLSMGPPDAACPYHTRKTV